MLRKLLYIFFISPILFSCNTGVKQDNKMANEPAIEDNVSVPDFNQDSAYAYIEKQMAFGPRVPETDAHKKCSEYFQIKLKEFTKDVLVQKGQVRTYDGKTLNINNIIASFNKESYVRILLCTHWDSRPFADKDKDPANHKKPVPAANDGASGVGVLMEVARQLHLSSPTVGIDIILLDAEDYGDYDNEDSWGLGSQYWAKNPHKQNYTARYGILLDMVGANNAIFTMEATSMYYAADIMRKVWNIAAQAGYSDFFSEKETGAITDDHLYINKFINIPTIDIIHYDPRHETGFFKYWHTLNDDIKIIDKKTLKAVGQTLLEVIYREK
jgi:hypothetical protein